MQKPWFMFAGICGIVLLIVLFSVVMGGYSSYKRCESRIKKSVELLVDACEKRSDLLDKLTGFYPQPEYAPLLAALDQAMTRADQPTPSLFQKEKLTQEQTIRDFSANQKAVTDSLIAILNQPCPTQSKEAENRHKALIRDIHMAQDNIFVVRKRYNKEVLYFNTRTSVFPGFLIAGLFGFDQYRYYPVPENQMLPSQRIFPEKP